MKHLCTLLSLVFAANLVTSFPDGAAIETCIIGNNPNHPATFPQPPSKSPYEITASDNTYSLGSTITVRIRGPPFKGFFVQARDGGIDGKWMGSWVEEPYTRLLPECSSITHNEPGLKEDVLLTWKAPFNKSGKVTFLVTVMQHYDTYWTNQVAKVIKRSRFY